MVKTIDGRESWAVFEMRRRRWKLALQSDWNGAAPLPAPVTLRGMSTTEGCT